MRQSLWLIILVLLSVAGPAQAQLYGSLSGMAVFVPDSDMDLEGLPFDADARFEPGWGVAGALGHGWDLPTVRPRLEVEAAFRRAELKDVKIAGQKFDTGNDYLWSASGMVNGALDFTVVPVVTPYVMAGLGFAVVDADDTDSDTVFAYQAGAGLGYEIGPATLFVGYRYFATTRPDLGGAKLDFETHNIEAGVRYGF